jgi:RNA polymerase sigma-70 factor (ECF subfamily)
MRSKGPQILSEGARSIRYVPTTVAESATDGFAPEQLELHRRELTGYCYRMLGSVFEAEDAVQETMIRAWRAQDGFEGRSSVRTWLHRVATNVCVDMLRGRKRRALPMGLVPSSSADTTDIGPLLPESTWVLPVPDARVLGEHTDPARLAAQRESVRLAFVAALQHLPARQRAVLLLREVMGWSAAEVADLLGATVVSVNSALQRARATLADRKAEVEAQAEFGAGGRVPRPADESVRRDLLAQFIDAFERYDVERFTSLLSEDAVQSMPPYPLWIRGAAEIGRWMLGPGAECRGSRLLPVEANGTLGAGQYRSDGQGGHQPFAIQLITIDGDRIAQMHSFLMPELFAVFGLPERL